MRAQRHDPASKGAGQKIATKPCGPEHSCARMYSYGGREKPRNVLDAVPPIINTAGEPSARMSFPQWRREPALGQPPSSQV